jgi:hypothetical protein
MRSLLLTLAVVSSLVGCATAPPETAQTPQATEVAGVADWRPMSLPGKTPTRYEWAEKDGRRAVMARADRSASIWRKKLQEPAQQHPSELRFSWWVQDVISAADLTDADKADAPARVLLAFGGDVAGLPLRTRLMFDVMETLTGEQPPYATLMYVWDSKLPVGTVLVHPRSDRVRVIIVDSGTGELRQWRDHKRDLAADFRLAFGEEPGPLQSVAFMTDSDNTRSQARTWYGAVEFQ